MFEAFGDLVASGVLGLQPGTAVGDAVQFFVMDVTKIFALLVIVISIMGLLRALLLPKRVRGVVRGRSDWQARGLRSASVRTRLSAPALRCPWLSVLARLGFRWA